MCKILKIMIPYVSQIAKKKLVDIIVDGILSLLPPFIDNIIGYRAVLRLPFGTFSLALNWNCHHPVPKIQQFFL